MNKNRTTYKNLKDPLTNAAICDLQTRDHVKKHIIDQEKCDLDKWQRRPGQMFWPPRIVKAVRDDSLIAFFGSGISLASGIPDWLELLRQMGLDKDAERDPLASGDMLTLAELVAHSVGFDSLQTKLRQAISVKKDKPTTAHFLLSALYLPVYLTTNYDSLFEDAFEVLHGAKPKVITNDLNVKSILGDNSTSWDAACPPDLDADERKKYLQRLLDRPYFRLAKSNRVSFVSDVFESMFNYNASLAVCIPLHDSQKFHGILFSVFQLNDSGFAKDIRSLVTNEPALLIIDSNGVLVIPPENEISIREPDDLRISTEKKSANKGYNYWELIQLSRRNKCIDRLVQNVVPLSQDDDVYTISPDAIAYSVVTELKNARWKVALTRFLRKQEDKEGK